MSITIVAQQPLVKGKMVVFFDSEQMCWSINGQFIVSSSGHNLTKKFQLARKLPESLTLSENAKSSRNNNKELSVKKFNRTIWRIPDDVSFGDAYCTERKIGEAVMFATPFYVFAFYRFW